MIFSLQIIQKIGNKTKQITLSAWSKYKYFMILKTLIEIKTWTGFTPSIEEGDKLI